MQPSERSIRNELHREAALVQIPGDLWEKLDAQLDREVAADRGRREMNRRLQGKAGLALVAAAGLFWLTVMPAAPETNQVAAPEPPLRVLATPDRRDMPSYDVRSRQAEQRTREKARDLAPDASLSYNTMLPR